MNTSETTSTTQAVARLCRTLDLPVPDDEIEELAALYGSYRSGLQMIDKLNRSEQGPFVPQPSPSSKPLVLNPDATSAVTPWNERSYAESRDLLSSIQQAVSNASPENAFINTVKPADDTARDAPLAGALLAIKDNIPVAGAPMTFGSRLDPQHRPSQTAQLIEQLLRAGALCVGKTNMGEFACSVNSSGYGPARNPWNLDRNPGGSSSGSAAAVAAGLADVGIGTDAGGSVRIPAAWCGLVGFRPTAGSLDTRGIAGVPFTIDNFGFMARRTETVRELMHHVSWRTRPSTATQRPKIGVVRDESFGRYDADVAHVYHAAIAKLETADEFELIDISLDGFAAAPYACIVICYAEVGVHHRELIRRRSREYTPTVRQVMRICQLFSATDYAQALRATFTLRNRYEATADSLDAVITPTVPVPAPLLDEEAHVPGDDPMSALMTVVRFTSLFNLTGHPTISLPSGRTSLGLPVGLQIVGRHFEDLALLDISARMETHLGSGETPPIQSSHPETVRT